MFYQSGISKTVVSKISNGILVLEAGEGGVNGILENVFSFFPPPPSSFSLMIPPFQFLAMAENSRIIIFFISPCQ